MRTSRLYWVGVGLAAMILVALACSSATHHGPQPPVGSGQLVINLVDAPNPQIDQLVVNVTQVTAHSSSAGWVVVQSFATPLQLDLLQLKTNSVQLGLVNLPPGKITQIRLYLTQDGNYVVPHDQTDHQVLKVPSGYQSGIKIHGPWEITECSRTAVTLDFDGEHSLEYHQTGTDLWILRPVIRAKSVEESSIGCGGDGEPGEGGSSGNSCDAETPCPEGEVCSSEICLGGTGSGCTTGSQCASSVCDTSQGHCAPGGTGTACGASDDCLSGSCTETGTCGSSTPGGACRSNTDCTNGLCDPEVGSCSECNGDESCAGLTCGPGACTCSEEGMCVQPSSTMY